MSSTFAARLRSSQAGAEYIRQRCLLVTISDPTLSRYADLTSKEIGHRACHPCRCIRGTLVQFGPLAVEIGPRLDRRAGMYSDAAASTTDPNIVLAGLAPGGSFGGTLYRSSDGGNTWSEVPALDGTSVFDIEFAADGTVYLGTQDSVRKSTDGGISWATLNLVLALTTRYSTLRSIRQIPRSCGQE